MKHEHPKHRIEPSYWSSGTVRCSICGHRIKRRGKEWVHDYARERYIC